VADNQTCSKYLLKTGKIFLFLDFSGNAREFLIISTKTSKYLNIYYQKSPKYFLFSITRMESKYF